MKEADPYSQSARLGREAIALQAEFSAATARMRRSSITTSSSFSSTNVANIINSRRDKKGFSNSIIIDF